MSNSKPQRREYKDYDFRTFPFHLLSLDMGNEIKLSKYNNIHIPTCIIEDDTKYNYYIKFNRILFHSRSFIYYLDTGENKKDAQPIFYCYPKLHPDYEKKDNEGNILKLRDEDGDEIEKFFEKFRTTIESLVNKLPIKLKSQITGKLSNLKSDFIDKITPFPVDKYKLPDENQSPTMKIRLWTVQKISNPAYENENSNNIITTKDDENEVIVPGTNPKLKILSKIHKFEKHNKTNKLQSKLIDNYEEIRNYVHSSSKHINASSGSMKNLTFSMELLSPVLHSKDGVDIQLTASKICITSVNSSARDRELSSNEQQELLELTKAAKKKYNIRDDNDQSNDETNIDLNDDSTIEEFPDSPPPRGLLLSQNKRKREDEEDDHIVKKQKIE